MKNAIRKSLVALSVLGLGIAVGQTAMAQVGDSRADPRSFVQGPTDNDNQSMNPVGVPHSTNNVRCANLQAQSGEYMACMENLPLAQPGTRASSGGGFFGRFRGGSASSGAGQPADRSPSRTPMSGSGIAPSSGY